LVIKIVDIKGSDITEPIQKMNLSLLIGPDRFTCLVNHKHKIIRLTIFEWQNEPDLLKTILVNLEAENISITNAESITLSVLKADEKIEYKVQADLIQQYFKRSYDSVQIKDGFETMLQVFKDKYPKKSAVFSYWQSGKIHLWALAYGAVDIYKSSYFRTAEDALYYVLQFYKQNNLSAEKDSLFLSGALSKDSTIFTLLYNYIADIEFVKIPTELKLENAEDLPEHLFFDIISANL
jgi:hypothetical protein